jgi:uncharacterized protein (DUF1919 family)
MIMMKLVRRNQNIKINNTIKSVTTFFVKKRIKKLDFTIVSSNCWGAKIYQELGLPYNTPFIGMFFYAPCYMKLLGNIREYLQSDISFASKSKYDKANEAREISNNYYPIGLINGDIEIHFLHLHDVTECLNKWNRRLSRMNWNRLFFSFTDRDLCNKEILKVFDCLPYKNKVCFTAKNYPDLKSCVQLPEFGDEPYVGDIYTNFDISKKHFDIIDWLNGGSGKKMQRSYLKNKLKFQW